VNTYAKCANFSLAQRLVSVEMPAAGVVPDLITWNTVSYTHTHTVRLTDYQTHRHTDTQTDRQTQCIYK
jgi:hypothetical protein